MAGTVDWDPPFIDESKEAWRRMYPQRTSPASAFFLTIGGSCLSVSSIHPHKCGKFLITCFQGSGGVGRETNPYPGAKCRMEPTLHLWAGHRALSTKTAEEHDGPTVGNCRAPRGAWSPHPQADGGQGLLQPGLLTAPLCLFRYVPKGLRRKGFPERYQDLGQALRILGAPEPRDNPTAWSTHTPQAGS